MGNESSHIPIISGDVPPAPTLVLLDERIPGSRQRWKFILILVGVSIFVIGSGDAIVSAVVLAIGLWMLVHDAFSVFGWEHIVVTDMNLRLERRLFGRLLKVVEIERARVVSIEVTPRPKGVMHLSEEEDRDQDVWGFDSGPIVIETDAAIYRVGQGFIKDRESARDVVRRVNEALSEK